MFGLPSVPNKSHNTGIFIKNNSISNHNKDNGKAMFRNWTKGGWKPGTWPVLRGAYSHLGCHLVLFDPLIRDRHSSFISYNFFSGPPQCGLLLELHLFELLKNVAVLNIVAVERAAVRPSLNAATQGRPRVTAPQINALHICCRWFDDQSQISLDGIYISDYFRGNVSIGVGFELLQKVFFFQKKWVTTGFLARWLY